MLNRASLLSIALTILAINGCVEVRAQQSSSTDERAEETRTGTISGLVVNDAGQPIAHAAVSVRAFGSGMQGRNAFTDPDGTFQIAGLDPAAYVVSAYMPAHVSAPRDPDSNQPGYYRLGDSVRLELIKGGVITGNVTTVAGEPVIAVRVRAYLIRDATNQASRYGAIFRERTTDDRGVYRIYGLAPGTYVVSAGGSGNPYSASANPYESYVPTFAPSSSRDTATEVTVRAGEESASVDIRYRGEQGHTVSGFARGPETGTPAGLNIRLVAVSSGESQMSDSTFQPPGARGFAFHGVADGDYDLISESFLSGGERFISDPRRVKVRGADVSEIELIGKPLGSISGRIALEESKAPECKGKRRPLFAETVVTPWHNEKNKSKDQPQYLWSLGGPALPDKQGDFVLRGLAPGEYRFHTRPLARYWYLQSITLAGSSAAMAKAAPAIRLIDAARNWTIVKPGARILGLTITLAEGAASFHGQIKIPDGESLPPKIFLYLVPAEREKSEDLLRFFAQKVVADGTFALNNLPPGRYWVMAKAVADSEANVFSRLRLPEEADARTKLRHEAESGKIETELKPCQNVTGFQLALDVSAKAPAPK